MSLPTEVLIAETISAEEATQLVEDFETIGLTADLREVSPRRSMGDIAWFVLAALPLRPFLDKLAEDFATNAYERLKTFVTRLFRRRRSSTGMRQLLVLQDTLTGVQVVLEPDLPPESYQQLLHLDLSVIRRGPLHYDLRRGQWRSELDEADKAPSPSPHGS
ncbi:MAG: hypothetical protein ACRDQZ_21980 [Mycobacteriales bacterium]